MSAVSAERRQSLQSHENNGSTEEQDGPRPPQPTNHDLESQTRSSPERAASRVEIVLVALPLILAGSILVLLIWCTITLLYVAYADQLV